MLVQNAVLGFANIHKWVYKRWDWGLWKLGHKIFFLDLWKFSWILQSARRRYLVKKYFSKYSKVFQWFSNSPPKKHENFLRVSTCPFTSRKLKREKEISVHDTFAGMFFSQGNENFKEMRLTIDDELFMNTVWPKAQKWKFTSPNDRVCLVAESLRVASRLIFASFETQLQVAFNLFFFRLVKCLNDKLFRGNFSLWCIGKTLRLGCCFLRCENLHIDCYNKKFSSKAVELNSLIYVN